MSIKSEWLAGRLRMSGVGGDLAEDILMWLDEWDRECSTVPPPTPPPFSAPGDQWWYPTRPNPDYKPMEIWCDSSAPDRPFDPDSIID